MSWLSALTGAAASYYGSGSGSSSSSSGGGLWGSIGNYFSNGSGWSDLLGGVLAGIGGSAAADREDEAAQRGHEWALALAALQGDQQRRTSLFEAQLADLAQQRNTARDRIALDTFGQFSVQHRRTPGYKAPATPTVPTWPTLENNNNGS